MKVLHSICQEIWKTQQWPQDLKRSVFIPIPKKGNAKACSNYCTIALISHTSTLAGKIPWMEPGGLQFMESLELDTTERLQFKFSLSCIGEGKGNPLQCSCLENPRDGGTESDTTEVT